MNANICIIIGRLTRDPELRHTPAGKAVVSFDVAVNEPPKRDGQPGDALFMPVTAWETTAENAGKYLRKGSSVYIQGRLSTESWSDKVSGEKRSKIKLTAFAIQFLDPKSDNGDSETPTQARSQAPARQQAAPARVDKTVDEDNQDIPF